MAKCYNYELCTPCKLYSFSSLILAQIQEIFNMFFDIYRKQRKNFIQKTHFFKYITLYDVAVAVVVSNVGEIWKNKNIVEIFEKLLRFFIACDIMNLEILKKGGLYIE